MGSFNQVSLHLENLGLNPDEERLLREMIRRKIRQRKMRGERKQLHSSWKDGAVEITVMIIMTVLCLAVCGYAAFLVFFQWSADSTNNSVATLIAVGGWDGPGVYADKIIQLYKTKEAFLK